jgi:hypothetical protein
MKKSIQLFFILCFINLASVYAQTDDYNEWILQQRLPDWTVQHLNDIEFSKDFRFSSFINPFYLESDFNGDGQIDAAITIESKTNNKKGIIILHNGKEEHFIIGAGIKFDNGGDNFSWMDIWKVHRDLNAQQLTYKPDGDIDASKPIKLNNVGIDVIKSESAGGLIYWDGQTYKWLQNGD